MTAEQPMTPLDHAHAKMAAAPDDDAARLRFFERLADAELFLLLTEEAVDENLSPELFELPEASFVLAFDQEERLAKFTGRAAAYAALSGRVIAGLCADQGIGLGVNLDVAPSSILIPPEALSWLRDTLTHAPEQAQAKIKELHPPKGLPEALLMGLDAKLSTAQGLASHACLVAVTYDGGGRGHLLGFVDPKPGAEGALAKAVSEALTFSGVDAGTLDVGFFDAADAMAAALARNGLRYDLPKPQDPAPRPAPGSDPARPPILK